MSTITTRTQFKDYCLRRLGFPVIDINVDDDQVHDRIEDAIALREQIKKYEQNAKKLEELQKKYEIAKENDEIEEIIADWSPLDDSDSSVRQRQLEFDRDAGVQDGLVRVLTDMFPVLEGVAITHRWGGPLGVPRDWMASVGRDGSYAWAGGYVGDGVGTTNLAGRTLAELITDRRTSLSSLPWVGHRSRRWEPEPLRWIGANLGLRTMTWADSIEDRTGRPSRLGSAMYRLLGQ